MVIRDSHRPTDDSYMVSQQFEKEIGTDVEYPTEDADLGAPIGRGDTAQIEEGGTK